MKIRGIPGVDQMAVSFQRRESNEPLNPRQDWEEPSRPKGSKEKPEPANITQFGLPDDQFELSTKLDAGGQGTVFRSEAEETDG